MGKRTRSQRSGRGNLYSAPSHKYKTKIGHPSADEDLKGEVIDIEHDPARNAPIARVKFSNNDERLVLVQEGISTGDKIECGTEVEIAPGNTTYLAEIPEGTPVCNVEGKPGDKGKYIRASGTYGILIAHDIGKAIVQLPSGELKWFSPKCKATIGVVAGGGRTEKPFVKAGNKFKKMKAKGGKYPTVRGVAMNAVDHPFGSGRTQTPGRSKSSARGASPGRKAGSIASSRTGKR
ncbi:Ribosomal protein L2 [Methanonatronarchaeum thermophilum]|uniref:Large ribosomal subunit protein uL2 n=1 Tax=Methanonatronarchaeum thermophilum TaxID=1927129 RepID=A0A1Y3GEW5_9EURY|nr:50S ribosomal protein L2 [Methanonatronarchaeum thermophilum]OUJ18843.1 Ribosomal protein L2 [Methanonatronarchaeum thermophilum]